MSPLSRSFPRCLALLLFFALCEARADSVLVQDVESPGGRGEMTVRFHNGKIRTDLADPVSTLFDPGTGETVYLQHRSKTFSRLTKEQTLELTKKLSQSAPPGTGGRLESTGQKQSIAGHPVELFLWTIGGLKFRFWIARDFPNTDAINALLDQLQSAGPAVATAALLPTRTALPGVRLRTEMESSGQHVSYTIRSITNVPSDDAPFRIPPDYKEVPFSISPESKAP